MGFAKSKPFFFPIRMPGYSENILGNMAIAIIQNKKD